MTKEQPLQPVPSVPVPFAAIVLAMLPAVLDQTILATALPTIALDIGRVTDLAWLVTAYVVAAAASTPLWGKLGDRHGRKLLLQVSLGVFVVASALCGAVQDITQLIVLRFLQGAAAGGLMTLAMAAVGDLVAPRERGRYQGYIAGAFAAATIVGPLIGGVLVDHASWRWMFLATAALFSITVFVPLFLETTTGASPTGAGLLLLPAMLGITVSTTLSGRSIARTGRYKRFPVAGLAFMTAALVLLAAVAGEPS